MAVLFFIAAVTIYLLYYSKKLLKYLSPKLDRFFIILFMVGVIFFSSLFFVDLPYYLNNTEGEQLIVVRITTRHRFSRQFFFWLTLSTGEMLRGLGRISNFSFHGLNPNDSPNGVVLIIRRLPTTKLIISIKEENNAPYNIFQKYNQLYSITPHIVILFIGLFAAHFFSYRQTLRRRK